MASGASDTLARRSVVWARARAAHTVARLSISSGASGATLGHPPAALMRGPPPQHLVFLPSCVAGLSLWHNPGHTSSRPLPRRAAWRSALPRGAPAASAPVGRPAQRRAAADLSPPPLPPSPSFAGWHGQR
eukprot:364577-Chlamydomonas_euryale.AAC.2